MHPDSQLVEMFRGIRQDARNDPKPTDTPHTFNIEFAFDGAGQLPTITDTVVWSAGRLSARLIGAEIIADAAGSASIDLHMGIMSSWPSKVTPYDTMPTLAASAAIELDISGWLITSLQPFDILSATLVTVAAPITCVTLALIYRRLKWPTVNTTLIDNSGNTLVNNTGTTLTLRG